MTRGLAVVIVLTLLSSCGLVDQPITLTDAGFNVPESAIHDAEADVYLVTNINGDPFGTDGRGFISRVSPSGEVLELKWIDGAADGVTLNAPKGMTIVGDALYVADVTSVRVFDRTTGKPTGEIAIEGVSFLNDITAGPDGVVYVSDTGLGPGFAPTGTDAIYKISKDGKPSVLVKSADLAKPNGLLFDNGGLLMVNWEGGALNRVHEDGAVHPVAKLPAAQLDGVVADGKGNFLISSWEGKCVYKVDSDGNSTVAVADLDAPADIGWDALRSRLLIPWFNTGQLDILPAP
jgi:sugar lactone lactonase YvrE